ncbi:winged helix-turn-helix domain-containing protein [Streptomyces sp. NPDC101118]|uniref:winged helix-turn-helix domain-containing protein n=1 Tax=Streptomyces sp. NPDC101118 TaxID=3366109 RepID=UPI00382D1D29
MPSVAGPPASAPHSEQPKGHAMTTAVPASTTTSTPRHPGPRLQVVGDRTPGVPAGGTGGGRVGYLVFLPADVDPVAVMTAHGIRPEVHPLGPATPPAPGPVPPPDPGTAAGPALGTAFGTALGTDPEVHSDDAVRVDRARRLVEVDGHELDLTYLEFALLAHFVAHPHTVHTRDALISGIWGYGHIGDGRTVDVHVARLRRKLGAAHRNRISTVRRVGYKYVPGRP